MYLANPGEETRPILWVVIKLVSIPAVHLPSAEIERAGDMSHDQPPATPGLIEHLAQQQRHVDQYLGKEMRTGYVMEPVARRYTVLLARTFARYCLL